VLLDRSHRGWALFFVVALTFATGWYLRDAARAPDGPSGGTATGLGFGIAGTFCIFFAALLGVRKKKPQWRVGRASTWLRGHLWLGALAFPLILFHADFRFGGPLASLLMGCFWVVFLTGIWGLLLQQILPRFMTRLVPEETVYEQIDHVRGQLLEEAVALARGKGPRRAVARAKLSGAIKGRVVESRAAIEAEDGDESRRPLIVFLDERMRPYFRRGGAHGTALVNRYRREALFEELKAQVDPSLHGVAEDLENICEQRAQLMTQRALHHWLHSWLLVHVPLSWLMIVLTIVHAAMALWY